MIRRNHTTTNNTTFFHYFSPSPVHSVRVAQYTRRIEKETEPNMVTRAGCCLTPPKSTYGSTSRLVPGYSSGTPYCPRMLNEDQKYQICSHRHRKICVLAPSRKSRTGMQTWHLSFVVSMNRNNRLGGTQTQQKMSLGESEIFLGVTGSSNHPP